MVHRSARKRTARGDDLEVARSRTKPHRSERRPAKRGGDLGALLDSGVSNRAVAQHVGSGNLSISRQDAAPDVQSGQEDASPTVREPEVSVIWFDQDSATPREDSTVSSRVHLQKAVSRTLEHLALVGDVGRVDIRGFASVEGEEEHNAGLSLERAATVAELLVDAGVPPEKISLTGEGENADYGPALSWNRRVEIRTTPAATVLEMEDMEVDAAPARQTEFRIRMISGGDGGEIVGGGVYTFELEATQTGHSRMITFGGGGLTGGLPANVHGPSSWSNFVATEPLLLDEFEGGGRIASAGVAAGGGGGFSVLIFYCGDRSTQKVEGFGASSGIAAGASWFHGWWEIRD